MARIILQVAAGASPWHYMPATQMLAEVLEEEGHEVINKEDHVRALEYVLRQHAGDHIELLDRALHVIHYDVASPEERYFAWEAIERISKRVPYAGEFYVRHNNFHFTSKHKIFTIDGLMEAVADRINNPWYKYFKEELLTQIIAEKPDILGLSVTDPRQVEQACVEACMIKEELTETIIILGGNYFAQVPAAREHKDFGRFGEFCDAVCYREGFIPLRELAETLDPSQASGVVWFKGGKAIVNPPTEEPIDFAELPNARPHAVRTWTSFPVRALFTQSNCPFRCDFCSIPAGSDTCGKKPRRRSPEQVALDIVASQAEYISFADESMPVLRQANIGDHLKKIMMAQHKDGSIPIWRAFMNFEDNLLELGCCQLLYDSGLRIAEIGLESLSPRMLEQAHKGGHNRPEQYALALRNLHAVGINTQVFVIVGYPGEHILDTLRWIVFFADNPPVTAVGGRFQAPQMSPIGLSGGIGYEKYIRIHKPTDKPLRPNLDFEYLDYEDENGQLVRMNHKIVRALRTILEECFRRLPYYAATSSCIKWEHRLIYRPEEIEQIARRLPPAEVDEHLKPVLRLVGNYLGETFETYEDLLAYMRSYVSRNP